MLFTDIDLGRAELLAEQFGGEVVESNADLVKRSDLILLCVKPAHLGEVAEEIKGARDGEGLAVASVLGATSIADIAGLLPPGTQVFRFMPNMAVESHKAVIAYVAGPGVDAGLERRVLDLFGELGEVMEVDEGLLDAVTAVASCSPAFFALAAGAVMEAGVAQGLDTELSRRLVTGAFEGTGDLLVDRGGDAGGIVEEVASPGGSTEAGLSVLESQDIKGAYIEAVRAAVERCRR